jgi:hypothetical protein
VATEGLSVEQFFHGPSVAVDERDALVCLDGAGRGRSGYSQSRAQPGGAGRVHVLSETALPEPLSIFPLTVLVQRIALELAEQVGSDPDVFGRRAGSQGGVDRLDPLRRRRQAWPSNSCCSRTPRELSEESTRSSSGRSTTRRSGRTRIIDYSCWRVVDGVQSREEFTHFDLMAVDDLANGRRSSPIRPWRETSPAGRRDWSRHGPDHPDPAEPEDLVLSPLLGVARPAAREGRSN